MSMRVDGVHGVVEDPGPNDLPRNSRAPAQHSEFFVKKEEKKTKKNVFKRRLAF
jgi:hypothetical protein